MAERGIKPRVGPRAAKAYAAQLQVQETAAQGQGMRDATTGHHYGYFFRYVLWLFQQDVVLTTECVVSYFEVPRLHLRLTHPNSASERCYKYSLGRSTSCNFFISVLAVNKMYILSSKQG